MSRLLILCPGQGGQHEAMFDLARTSTRSAALLERWHVPVAQGALFRNRSAQPAIVAATLAMWDAIRDLAPQPALVAGYSIGELAAHSVAGALDPADAVLLAGERAALMDACVQDGAAQALVAVSGLPLARIAALAAASQFAVAIETGGDSAIAGGLAIDLPAFDACVTDAGGRLQRLPIEVASHTALMQAAVAPFAAAVNACRFAAYACPVLSGVAGTKIACKDDAVAHLSRQLAEKIVWGACLDACVEAGVTVALELGPGAALSRMLQARHPAVACRSVFDFRSLAGIGQWLARHCA